MFDGYTTLEQAREAVSKLPTITYRMALRGRVNALRLHTLILETSPAMNNPTLQPFRFDYSELRFAGGTTSGEEASSWLAPGEKALTTDDSELTWRFHVDALTDGSTWNRHHGHEFDGYVTVPWPYARIDFNYKNNPYIEPYNSLLVADGCPFFPTQREAILRLVYGARVAEPNPGFSTDPHVIVRIADTRAWLDHITITPASLSIIVAGDSVKRSRLVVSGPPDFEDSQQVDAPGEYSVALPNGVSLPLWIVLSRGDTWLDYYCHDERWPNRNRRQSNVTIEAGDLNTELAVLIAQGEGLTTEFKEDVPKERDQMLKTVAAFANGEGGVLLLGVKDGTGELVECRRNPDELIQMIRDNVFPEPPIHIHVAHVEHRRIVAIYVEKGAAAPYGLHPTNTHYYVRRGATTFPARPEEVRAIVLASQERVSGPFAGYLPKS